MEEHIDSGFVLMSSEYHNGDKIPQHNTSQTQRWNVRLSVCSDIRGYHGKFCLAGERGQHPPSHSLHCCSFWSQYLQWVNYWQWTPCFRSSKPTSFAAYNWTTRSSKISSVQRVEPGIAPWVYNGCESWSLWGGWNLLILRWYLLGERI